MSVAKLVLIGGAPLVGKSSVARILAAELGFGCISTDDIGQAIEAVTTPQSHPALHKMAGQDYREYYVRRGINQLVADAEERHAALWPALQKVILAHATWGGPIVMEGWALWPERVAQLATAGVASVWLIAGDGLLEQRVRQDRFWQGASDEQAMIGHFVGRGLRINAHTCETAKRLGLPAVIVSRNDPPHAVAERCRQYIGS